MLISPSVSKNKVHIKLSSYIGAFLQYVYGAHKTDGIIYLPEDFKYACPKLTLLHSRLYNELTTTIIDPDWNSIIMQPNASYSDYAMTLIGSPYSMDENYRNFIPDTNENLYQFALPDCYLVNKVAWSYTTDHCQLTPSGAAKFRQICKLFFWVAFSWDIDNIYDPLLELSKMEMFDDFCLRYNIPYKDLNTIYRNYKRERGSCMHIVNRLFDRMDPVHPIFFLNNS